MELKLFDFIENVTEYLEDSRNELNVASRDIRLYFEKVLEDYNEGSLNINSKSQIYIKSKRKNPSKWLLQKIYISTATDFRPVRFNRDTN